MYAGVDVVVATPQRLVLHLAKDHCRLNQVKHVVVDEADTLFDSFYETETSKLLRGLQKDCHFKPQIVIVGATRTGCVSAFIKRHLNDTRILPVVTMDAHLPPPQCEQVFVPTQGKRRLAVLWDVLSEVPAVGRKTLIFTNRIPTCKSVWSHMAEHGFKAVALHGLLHVKHRKKIWSDFNGTGADIMVCTNLASRGLDFGNVHHVIMFDFPHNLADYLHRVGRTARGGKAGRVTTITPRRYWPFVSKIQEASKSGQPISVRNATKKAKKILQLEKWDKAVRSDLSKRQRKIIRKKIGLAPRPNLGTLETKRIMKRIARRGRAVKQVKFLWSRGILKKGYGLPRVPDAKVEASETQTVSTLVRARDGLLQVIPRRRRHAGPQAASTEVLPTGAAGRPESKGAARRRRRPVM